MVDPKDFRNTTGALISAMDEIRKLFDEFILEYQEAQRSVIYRPPDRLSAIAGPRRMREMALAACAVPPQYIQLPRARSSLSPIRPRHWSVKI